MRLKSLLPHGLVCRLQQRKRENSKDPRRARILADESLSEDEKRWLWKHGFYPLEKKLYGLTEDNIHLYLDHRSYRKLHPINGRFSKLIDSKGFLPLLIDEVPEIHVVIEDGRVRYCKGVERTDAPAQLRNYVYDGGGVLACKPHGGTGGEGFSLLDSENFETTIEAILESGGTYIINEKIEQHPYAQALFPDAVNPLRIVVMRDVETEEIFLVSASQRIGTRHSAPVSNAAAGGLTAPIDPEDGRLKKAVRYVGGYGWCTSHPDTGAPIQGVEIPGWDEIAEEILETLNGLQWLDYAGLDVAVTSKGFTMIEINSLPGRVSPQILNRPLLARPRVRQFFESKGLNLTF